MSSDPTRGIPSDLRRTTEFLDSYFRGPFGFRFGWDGILGLIPGVGDFVTGAMSMYIIARAASLGATPSVLLRMGGNVLFENLVDLIPLFGNIFDFFWKANSKNVMILDSYLQRPRQVTVQSRIWIVATLLLIFAMVIGFLVLSLYILRALWMWIQDSGTAGAWV